MGATIFGVVDVYQYFGEYYCLHLHGKLTSRFAFSDVRLWSLDRKVLRPPTSGWTTYCYGKCGRII
jgi:hypothetical protein